MAVDGPRGAIRLTSAAVVKSALNAVPQGFTMSSVAKKDTGSAAAPAGLRLYAIGDVHGRSDLLDDLFAQIAADLKSAPASALTILLGDYVDRGPDSFGVVARLARGDVPTPFCALRGNHEDVLLRFLDDESLLDSWRRFGGVETLHSYGVDVSDVMRGRGFEKARDALRARMPQEHASFLEETRMFAEYGDYFFVHAGIRPSAPLNRQRAEDMLWIRDEFLNASGAWEKVVVHGHTPVTSPDVRRNRINIDTGAFATGVLTAVVLEGASFRFLQSRGESCR